MIVNTSNQQWELVSTIINHIDTSPLKWKIPAYILLFLNASAGSLQFHTVVRHLPHVDISRIEFTMFLEASCRLTFRDFRKPEMRSFEMCVTEGLLRLKKTLERLRHTRMDFVSRSWGVQCKNFNKKNCKRYWDPNGIIPSWNGIFWYLSF